MHLMTTKEIAAYLRINEKKVYALISEEQIPVTRVSGKWLFDRSSIDVWMKDKMVFPASGLMAGLLKNVLIIQGSDDILLDNAINGIRDRLQISIAGIKVGSIGGLEALISGRAHAAVFHLAGADVPKTLRKMPCYVIDLFTREQGLAFKPRSPGKGNSHAIREIVKSGSRFAARQKSSGTWRLTEKIFAREKISPTGLEMAGPFCSHIEAALAVMDGRAASTMTIKAAADLCGLDFLPVGTEEFRMVIPSGFFGHPNVREFLDLLLERIKETDPGSIRGYTFETLGRLSASMKE